MKSLELFTACKYMYNYIDIEYIHNYMMHELNFTTKMKFKGIWSISLQHHVTSIPYVYTNHVQLYRLS